MHMAVKARESIEAKSLSWNLKALLQHPKAISVPIFKHFLFMTMSLFSTEFQKVKNPIQTEAVSTGFQIPITKLSPP